MGSELDALDGLIAALKAPRRFTVEQGDREPQKSDIAFVFLDTALFPVLGRARPDRWRFAVRLVVDFQENKIAERQLLEHIKAAKDAIEADRTFGGKAELVTDIEVSAAGADGYVEVPVSGGTAKLYRSAVLRFEITAKYP